MMQNGRIRRQSPFRRMRGHEAVKAFWQQFQMSSGSGLLNHRMKQLVELLRMARATLQALCINLWPAEVLPTSFFRLIAWLQEALPQVSY